MNIYLHELRMYWKSGLIWLLAISTMLVFFMAMFPAFEKDAGQLLELLQNYPEAILKALEIDETLFSVLGFYGYIFTYISLAGSIQAMNLGLSLVSREVRDKTVEFLLTKPVTRTNVLNGKLCAAITLILLSNGIFILLSFLVVNGYNSTAYNGSTLFYMSLSLFFIQFFFLGLGLMISLLSRKIKSVIPLSLGVVFAFFILRAIASIVDDSWLTYFTPFSYFDGVYIREYGNYDWPYLLLSIGLSILFITSSYVLYNKKDIPTN